MPFPSLTPLIFLAAALISLSPNTAPQRASSFIAPVFARSHLLNRVALLCAQRRKARSEQKRRKSGEKSQDEESRTIRVKVKDPSGHAFLFALSETPAPAGGAALGRKKGKPATIHDVKALILEGHNAELRARSADYLSLFAKGAEAALEDEAELARLVPARGVETPPSEGKQTLQLFLLVAHGVPPLGLLWNIWVALSLHFSSNSVLLLV